MTRRGLVFLALVVIAAAAAEPTPHWYKGNVHTHSLWSDGNDYPEMIADRYKQAGYHFLAISDHNVLAAQPRWLELKPPAVVNGAVIQLGGGAVLDAYRARFGTPWVATRQTDGKAFVRLKPFVEYRALLEEPGRFLLVPSAEITSTWRQPATATAPERSGPVHMNHLNAQTLVPPVTADNAFAIMQQSVAAVQAQRVLTGEPMLIHLNHPNYLWGVTAEELMRVDGERFFEVYNGHPGVHNRGDATHLSTDAMWDAILARRLSELRLGVMYGLATDDAHEHHHMILGQSNPFRGWIMVRANELTPPALIRAMESGDFYASTGVTLADVQRSADTLSVDVRPEPGVTYLIQFIGTRRGYDPGTTRLGEPGKTLEHLRYSQDVGVVLAEARGPHARYTLAGDELYVRAKVISSKEKPNASVADEFECAWTQPLVNSK